MKYLITGGCGFLGSNIAAQVLREGSELVLLDNLSRHGAPSNLAWLRTQGEFTFVHGDIRNTEDCDRAVAEHLPDVVFHLAGQVAMTTSLQRPRKDFEINALGTLNLLEAVRAHCPKAAFIYSSTNKVYGDLEQVLHEETATRYVLPELPQGVPEDIGLSFHSPYGCSKGSADQYVLDYARMFGLRTAVFRHSSMYGGRQFYSSDQGWIGWFCEQAIAQADGPAPEFTVSGNGKQVRDLLHADDMVALYLRAAADIDKVSGEAFNIGGGPENSLSILELLEHLGGVLGVKLRWEHIAPRESDQRVFVADLRKVQSRLGWTPKVSKEAGLQHMIEWVRSIRSPN
jgi:CDP-paratose 2-epimerase